MKELFITNNSEYDLVVRPRSNRLKEVMFTAKVNTHHYTDGRSHAEDGMDSEFHSHHHYYGSGGDGDLHSSVAQHRGSWYLNSLIGNDSNNGNSSSGIGNNDSSSSSSNNNNQNLTSFSMRDDNHQSVNDGVGVGVGVDVVDIQGINNAINDNRDNHDDRTQDNNSYFHSTHEQSVIEKTISEVRVSAHSSFRLCVYYSPSLDNDNDDNADDGDDSDGDDSDGDEGNDKNRIDDDEDEDTHRSSSTIHNRMSNNNTTNNTAITTSTSSASTTKSKSKTNYYIKNKKRKLLRNPNYLDLHQDDFYLLFELQSPREYGEISLFCHVEYCHSFVEADSEIRFSRCESGESYTKEWIIQNRVSESAFSIILSFSFK